MYFETGADSLRGILSPGAYYLRGTLSWRHIVSGQVVSGVGCLRGGLSLGHIVSRGGLSLGRIISGHIVLGHIVSGHIVLGHYVPPPRNAQWKGGGGMAQKYACVTERPTH